MTEDDKKNCSTLLKQLIASQGLKDSEFGKIFGLARQTISNYTTGKSEPNWSILNAICDKFAVNPRWLLTGEGEMYGETPQSPGLPPEELNEKLTPTQREMLTFQRLMREYNAPPEKIIDGIMAIATAKSDRSKSLYRTAEPPADPGYNNVHESRADFGEKE